jgi:hypothetical protein
LATVAGGVGIYLLFCAILLGFGYLQISLSILLLSGGFAMLAYGAIALSFNMDWNLSPEDPCMVLVEMLIASTVVIITALYGIHLQPLVAFGGLALIVVGASRLNTREVIVFATYSLALFAIPLLDTEELDALSGRSVVVMLLAVVALVFICHCFTGLNSLALSGCCELKSVSSGRHICKLSNCH